MKTILTILLVLILAADTVVYYQMRRHIHSLGREMEEPCKVLSDEEVYYVESRSRLMSVLGVAALVVFLLRFVFFELLPLIQG